MTRKKSHNELYWESQYKRQIRDEYRAFLAEDGSESTPEKASIFAARVLGGSAKYHGYTERQLIQMLAGELPYMYD